MVSKKNVCKLATTSVLCFILSVIIFFLALSSEQYVNEIGVASFVLLVGSIVLGIVSLIRINLGNKILSGSNRALVGIIASSLLLTLFSGNTLVMGLSINAQSLICRTNLKGIGTALAIYAAEHDDQLPAGERWCDLLVMRMDVEPKTFVCPSTEEWYGESSYGLNENVVGMKFSEIPKDMVIAFETNRDSEGLERDVLLESREFVSHIDVGGLDARGEPEKVVGKYWNQFGGPELLNVDNHAYSDKDHRFCNVLFGDGNVMSVQLQELGELKWSIDGTVEFPRHLFGPETKGFEAYRMAGLTGIGAIVFVFTGWVFCRYKVKEYWSVVLVVSILSTLAGLVFGTMGGAFYYSLIINRLGLISGGVFGLLAGICFSVLMANMPDRIKDQERFRDFVTSCGMGMGVICSSLVHLVLMVANENLVPYGIFGGIPFGIIAGVILGAVTGGFVVRSYRKNDAVI